MNLSTSSYGIVITTFTFSNTCIDAVNLSNILNPKDMTCHVPEYFYHQTVLIVSDYYTNTTAPKRFTYNKALQEINIQEYLQNPIVFCVFCFVLFVFVQFLVCPMLPVSLDWIVHSWMPLLFSLKIFIFPFYIPIILK